MYHQTQTPQIFTVFGSYPIGPQGDYFPSSISRPDGESCRPVTNMDPAKAIVYPPHEAQQVHP